jgi:amino acid transporter
LPVTETAGERRDVGPVHLLALGVNGIVGVGIFFAPADIAARAPGAGTTIIALTALALVPVALAFATLGRRFDEDGGPVVFARAAFGPLPAFVVGWIAYVSAISSTAAVIVGLTAAVGPSVGVGGQTGQRVAATVLAALLALLCARGLRLSAWTWTALTALKLVPLCVLAVVFLVAPGPRVAPVAVASGASWGAAALIAVFTYQGFEIVPVLAGRARRPTFSVPFATVGSLALASVLYVILQAACTWTVPRLAESRAPLVDAASAVGGASLAALVGAGTSLSALGIAFGMMAATPFYLAALARVDALGMGLPLVSDRGVPRRALLVTWTLVTLLIQIGGRSELFALSSIAVLTQYLVTAAALGVLAVRRQRALAPRHLALAVPASIVSLALAAGASAGEARVAAIALIGGLVGRAVVKRRERVTTSEA